LKSAFFFEVFFPVDCACWAIFEYQVVSLFPDVPCCNDENFHEVSATEVLPSQFHHLEERDSHLPLDSNRLPAIQSKRTAKKQVEGGFFSLSWAQDTIVVVTFKLVSFPF